MATAPRAALLARIISLVVLFIAPASPAHGGAGGAGAGAARLPALQCRLRGEEMASAPDLTGVAKKECARLWALCTHDSMIVREAVFCQRRFAAVGLPRLVERAQRC